jgi:hypothetical protein
VVGGQGHSRWGWGRRKPRQGSRGGRGACPGHATARAPSAPAAPRPVRPSPSSSRSRRGRGRRRIREEPGAGCESAAMSGCGGREKTDGKTPRALAWTAGIRDAPEQTAEVQRLAAPCLRASVRFPFLFLRSKGRDARAHPYPITNHPFIGSIIMI